MSGKKPTKAELAASERADACAKLRTILSPGDTVYTMLNHVSRSGMMRSISLYVVKDGENVYLTGYAARALGEKRDRYDGISMPGCGMDMGFALVYNLGCTLWPHGTPKPHGRRNGEPDSDGGYALKQRWL
jgi:hypothetical protein